MEEVKDIIRSIIAKNDHLKKLYRTYPGAVWVGNQARVHKGYTLQEGVVEQKDGSPNKFFFTVSPITEFAVIKTKSRVIILER